MKKAFFVILFFFQSLSFAQTKEVNVVGGVFLGIVEYDGAGPYQLILKEAAKRSGITINEKVYPIARAVDAFTTKKALAIYGMTDAIMGKVGIDKIITSYPLGVYKLYIFTKKGSAPVSSYEELKGKRVGGVVGYKDYYSDLIKKGIKIVYIDKEEFQKVRLENGSVDAILGFLPDWLPYKDSLSYDSNFPVKTGYDYMTVWNTPDGRDFVERISVALHSMKEDGTLKKMLGKRYMEFTYKATKRYEWIPKE